MPFESWQVVGNRLFTLAGATVSVFEFDRAHSTYKQLATYRLPTKSPVAYGTLAVSPDGTLIYVPIIDYDLIIVLDANLLIAQKPPLITEIGTLRAPFKVAVDPVVR